RKEELAASFLCAFWSSFILAIASSWVCWCGASGSAGIPSIPLIESIGCDMKPLAESIACPTPSFTSSMMGCAAPSGGAEPYGLGIRPPKELAQILHELVNHFRVGLLAGLNRIHDLPEFLLGLFGVVALILGSCFGHGLVVIGLCM